MDNMFNQMPLKKNESVERPHSDTDDSPQVVNVTPEKPVDSPPH